METIFYIYDENGFYLSHNYYLEAPESSTDVPILFVFQKPKFNGAEWVEGATPEEIQAANLANVPMVVSKRQLKQSLILADIPLSNIDYAISQIANPTEKALMEVFWNDSTEFERNHPKLIEFSQALGMTETQVDQLFIMASNL
jgi:hypothetical protein